MHDHDNNSNKNGGHKGMMWMMIPCLLLLAFIMFSRNGLGASKYLVFIMLGVCVVPHIWMMFKGGHNGHGNYNTEDKTDNTSDKQLEAKEKYNKSEHGGSCCH